MLQTNLSSDDCIKFLQLLNLTEEEASYAAHAGLSETTIGYLKAMVWGEPDFSGLPLSVYEVPPLQYPVS